MGADNVPVRAAHALGLLAFIVSAAVTAADRSSSAPAALGEALLSQRQLLADPAILTGTFPFSDVDVFFQMIPKPQPALGVILMLHGKRFSSADWVKIGTLKALGDLGFRVIAVDLPGYGKTKPLPYNDNNMRSELVLAAFAHAEAGENVTKILVSPSMSGKYALPFMDRYGPILSGWAALAPVGVQQWGGPWETTHRQVKMLAAYGATDPMLPDADLLVKMFVQSTKIVLPKTGHACYMDDPTSFNRRLVEFVGRCPPVAARPIIKPKQ